MYLSGVIVIQKLQHVLLVTRGHNIGPPGLDTLGTQVRQVILLGELVLQVEGEHGLFSLGIEMFQSVHTVLVVVHQVVASSLSQEHPVGGHLIRESGQTRSDEQGGGRFLILHTQNTVCPLGRNVVLVGVAEELAPNSVGKALYNEVVAFAPVMMAPIVCGRDVSSQHDPLSLVFTSQQLGHQPGQLVVWVGGVGHLVEVGQVTHLGVQHHYLQVFLL